MHKTNMELETICKLKMILELAYLKRKKYRAPQNICKENLNKFGFKFKKHFI